MSLRARVTLGILLLVGLSGVLLWGVATRAVFRPFADEVFAQFLDTATEVAERVEQGAPPGALGRRLGLVVRIRDRPPPAVGRGRHGRELRAIEHNGRQVLFPPGPRNHVLVETRVGWVSVQRDLDLERPQARLRLALLLVLGLVGGLAAGLASMATKPLTTAREGMERIARGDLSHRLEVTGPTELRRVAVAFNRMADRIDTLVRTERELMAGMSHDLRTPLSRLRLEVELLRDEGVSERRATAMEGDLAELDGLIGSLLQLSRLQIGLQGLDRQTVDLRVVAQRAAVTAQVQTEILGEGITEGDAELLHRAVVNLLQNVRRYAGDVARVRIAAHQITVEDEGPGVPDEALPRLFEPFWRGEGSRSKSTGGLGLGLMFVRQVAELHGGTASARNLDPGLAVTLDLGA